MTDVQAAQPDTLPLSSAGNMTSVRKHRIAVPWVRWIARRPRGIAGRGRARELRYGRVLYPA